MMLGQESLSPLGKYLQRQKMTQVEFSFLLNAYTGLRSCTQGQVSKWARGKVVPLLLMQRCIMDATGGAVSVLAWTRWGNKR